MGENRPCPTWQYLGDSVLPSLGIAKVRQGGLTVGAKAGHNGEHHNHNDVGSFIVHSGRTCFLTDLGAPIYSGKIFGPERYRNIFCGSQGHSVPVIDEQEQKTGREFAGTLHTDTLSRTGAKEIVIEMAGAYGLAHLQRLTRRLELLPEGSGVILHDYFAFDSVPKSIVEVFMTTQPAELTAEGLCVLLPSADDGTLMLTAVGTEGAWRIETLTEESKDSRRKELIRRISFVPASVAAHLELEFRIDPLSLTRTSH